MIDGNDRATWGIVGDGIADDSVAVRHMLDAAQTGTYPQKVRLPAGRLRFATTVERDGPVIMEGEGPEATVITPPASTTALRVGSLTTSQPHGLSLSGMTFRHNSPANTDQPIIDIQQYGRKWTLKDINFDGAFSDRPALRLSTSWVGAIRDVNFWKFGAEGKPGQQASVIVAPDLLPNSNGPINNLIFDGCAWERVQTCVDLHDPNTDAKSTTNYSITFICPRFKNSATDGPMPYSVGIRSNSNQTFCCTFITPFFEDMETCASIRGWSWSFINAFVQSAKTAFQIVGGGGHLFDGLILQPSNLNGVECGVHATTGMTGITEVRRIKSITGATYLGVLTQDDTGGNLRVSKA